MREVDPADDREHPLERIRGLLPRGGGVAGVEAEPDPDGGLRRAHRPPETREGVAAARHRMLAAGRVLDVERDLALEHLKRSRPAADARLDPVLRVARVDDDGGGLDLPGRLAGLLEDLSRAVANVAPRRADVDQVGRVDVKRRGRGAQLGRVGTRPGLLPPLRVRQEHLHAVRSERECLLQGVIGRHMRSDGWLHAHRASITRLPRLLRMKRIVILGATGSIGEQALDVISGSPEVADAALPAGRDWKRLVAQARDHGAPQVALADADAAASTTAAWNGPVLTGEGGIR